MKMDPNVLQQHMATVGSLVNRQDSNMEALKKIVTNPDLNRAGLFSEQATQSYVQLVRDWDGLKAMLGAYKGIVGNHIVSVSTTDRNGANSLGGGGTRTA
jgi:hypothetical protein